MFIIFYIGSVAETNRAPFDLAEAESELVSGFMTEHSAVIFVMFFLAEYASIVLICILNAVLFLGGYLIDYTPILYLLNVLAQLAPYEHHVIMGVVTAYSTPYVEGIIYAFTIGIKSSLLIFGVI